MSTPYPPLSSIPATPSESATEFSEMHARRRATEFAGHSWNLATGGLKTLTAKRELPPRPERRVVEPTDSAAQRSYTFALVILACVVVMLVSGGIVLFVLLQP